MENLNTLLELKELRKMTNSTEAVKAQIRKELTCRRTLDNLRDLCEEENLPDLARKCAKAAETMKGWQNPDGNLDTNFTIPRLATSDRTKVIVSITGKIRKKYKLSHFQGNSGPNDSHPTNGIRAEQGPHNIPIFQMDGSMDTDESSSAPNQ